MREGRLVSTWKVCQGQRHITSTTRAMYSSGKASWSRSLIEFTKIRCGEVRSRGSSSLCGASLGVNHCSYACPGTPRKRLAKVSA